MRIGRHSLKSLITALTPESIGYSKRVGRFSDLSLPLRAFPQHCVAVTYDARVLKELQQRVLLPIYTVFPTPNSLQRYIFFRHSKTEDKKSDLSTLKSRLLFCVGVDGFEPPTLCL